MVDVCPLDARTPLFSNGMCPNHGWDCDQELFRITDDEGMYYTNRYTNWTECRVDPEGRIDREGNCSVHGWDCIFYSGKISID